MDTNFTGSSKLLDSTCVFLSNPINLKYVVDDSILKKKKPKALLRVQTATQPMSTSSIKKRLELIQNQP